MVPSPENLKLDHPAQITIQSVLENIQSKRTPSHVSGSPEKLLSVVHRLQYGGWKTIRIDNYS